jgi:hypothetical protein
MDCAFHASGSGFADYGAGMGFDLNDDSGNNAQPYDAHMFTGIRYWVKGTITGTRTTNYAAQDQTIHLKILAGTPPLDDGGPSSRHGDDYGTYCPVDPTNWTLCQVAFVDATRDGFNSEIPKDTDMLDLTQLLKLQFELSRYSTQPEGGAAPPPVNFDIWIDDVEFY